MSETDFIRALARRTGCGLLLDINNVFVSATNHGLSALYYLADFPLSAVGEIHLAGHAEQSDDEGAPLLIDSHDRPVADAVWELFEIGRRARRSNSNPDRMGQRHSRMAAASRRKQPQPKRSSTAPAPPVGRNDAA